MMIMNPSTFNLLDISNIVYDKQYCVCTDLGN